MKRLFAASALLALTVCGYGQINPASQIRWPLASGSGAPTQFCPSSAAASTVSGSPSITVSSTTGIVMGQVVSGTGIPTGTTVEGVNSGTLTVTLSANATATGTGVSLNFNAYNMPYTDTQNNHYYTCAGSGWLQVDANGNYVPISGGSMTGPLNVPGLSAGWFISVAAGDSLTAGNQDSSGTTYPGVLQSLLGTPVYNLGVPGQTSTQIAVRLGADATTVTNNFTIPTSSCAVTVTFPTGYEPASGANNQTKNYYTGQGVLGSIAGVLGYTEDNGSHVYTFTPISCPSSAVSVTAGTAWTPALYDQTTGQQWLNGPVVIWAGRNNYANASQVESDIASIVSELNALGNTDYLILSIPNGDNPGVEWSGDSNYNAIIALNSYLSTTYGSHYLDIRSYMVSQYNPSNGQDAIDHTNDVPPSSLRAFYTNSGGSCYANLASNIGSTDTTIALSGSTIAFSSCHTILIDSEAIEGSISGSNWIVYTGGRGWGGTTAASHSSGALVQGWDYLHYNAAGYTLIAKKVNSVLSAMNSQVPPQNSLYAALAALPINSLVQQVTIGPGLATYFPGSGGGDPLTWDEKACGYYLGGTPGTGHGVCFGWDPTNNAAFVQAAQSATVWAPYEVNKAAGGSGPLLVQMGSTAYDSAHGPGIQTPLPMESTYNVETSLLSQPCIGTDSTGKHIAGTCPPIRAGTWSISSSTSAAVTFATAFNSTPTSCSVTATSDPTSVGAIWYSGLSTTGMTVNAHTSGTISGTYQCVVNNSN